jgi:hypothetical protein
VPASHKQLLGLFGVSPQAAVLVAAAMSALDDQQHPECGAWMFMNPHILAMMPQQCADSIRGPVSLTQIYQTAMHATLGVLEPQLQQRSHTQQLLELLPPVLLYGAAYAAADGAGPFKWVSICEFVGTAVAELEAEPCLAAARAAAVSASCSLSAKQVAAALAGAIKAPPLPAEVRDEMLVLSLNLLQQLQQTGTDASSKSGPATAAGRTEAQEASKAIAGIVLSLCNDLHAALLEGHPATTAAAAEDEQAAVPTLLTLEDMAAEPAAPAAQELPTVWQQQAGRLFTALEGCVRAGTCQGQHKLVPSIWRLWIRDPCLLLQLAQAGSSEQQVACFNLLMSLLSCEQEKSSGSWRIKRTLFIGRSRRRVHVIGSSRKR